MEEEIKKGASVQDMIGYLLSLKEQAGWKIIERVLDENIKDVEAKLNGDIELLENETIKTLQDKRKDRVRLKNIIDELVNEWKEKEAFDPELDPFY